MSEREPDPAERLHAFFDREITPEHAAELEAQLRADPELRRRREALRAVEAWLQGSRPAAPAHLSARIDRAIEDERDGVARKGVARDTNGAGLESNSSLAAPAPVSGNPGRGRVTGISGRPRSWLRWAWVPAAAAAAVAILLLRHGPALPPSTDQTVGRDFVVAATDARQVCLVGDFNQWKVCQTPLTPAGNGVWKIHLDLAHGRHEYMFVIDGRWQTDPSVPETVDDGFGSKNTLLLL